LTTLEGDLGYKLPDAFRRFTLLNGDGAEPESNVFDLPPDNQSDVRQFIPIREINTTRRITELFPHDGCPFAYDSGGNLLFFQARRPAVHFWAGDDAGYDGVEVAPDFETFMEQLAPFSL